MVRIEHEQRTHLLETLLQRHQRKVHTADSAKNIGRDEGTMKDATEIVMTRHVMRPVRFALAFQVASISFTTYLDSESLPHPPSRTT